MEDDIALAIRDISKRYRLGIKEDSSDNIFGAVLGMVKSPLSNYRKYRSLYRFDESSGWSDPAQRVDTDDILWALKGVTFDVRRGEVLGVIGRNGAGKSTLLKVLSRITPPTTGRVEIRGRVSSLLEVGTGFHPELTGRENVYMNGTILGMRKREIDQVFDEVVEFSGVGKFLETPVKRYSSGMRVRLAFSVAAHLNPEILIVDEVLAVGDAAFQRKCMDKMEDVGSQGRTVIFVSHNMPAVTRMCDRVVLLNEGMTEYEGEPHEVVSYYLKGGADDEMASRKWEPEDAPRGPYVRMLGVSVRSEQGQVQDVFNSKDPVCLQMEYEVTEPGHVIQPHFGVFNGEGVRLFVAMEQETVWSSRPRTPGRYVSRTWIPGNLLAEGLIVVNAALWATEPRREKQVGVKDVVGFQIVDREVEGSARGAWVGEIKGAIRPKLEWETVREEEARLVGNA